MKEQSVQIRVPATVGNFAGVAGSTVALEGSLNVKATLRADGQVSIRYFGENGERVPRGRSNLVVRAMESALKLKAVEWTGADFEIYSSVPVGVGLGSSAAAVLAGLIVADRLFELGFDEKSLFELAAVHESRSENLQAAWFGGLRSAATEAAEGDAAPQGWFPEKFMLNVVIPHFHRLDTPFASAADKNVPGLADALGVGVAGAGVFLCGSGPAVGIIAEDLAPEAVRAVQDGFARHGLESRHVAFRPSRTGARDWNAAREAARSRASGATEPLRKPSLIPV